MPVHGLRLYRNDLMGLFGPIADLWRGHVIANEFGVSINERGEVDDPLPSLQAQYGASLIAADVKRQFVLLRGEDFNSWGPTEHFIEGAFLPIFHGIPSFPLLTRLYYSRTFRLTSGTWPKNMRALLQLWDGVYWQMFTTEPSDVKALIKAHAGDPRLEMFHVDLEHEYPDPSNQELDDARRTGIDETR
jgi:hypothetical protein